MKKLLSVLMVLVLIFSACSKPEEPISEQPENGEPSETEEENKFSIEDIDTSEYDEVKDLGFLPKRKIFFPVELIRKIMIKLKNMKALLFFPIKPTKPVQKPFFQALTAE